MKPVLPSGRQRGLSFLRSDDWTSEQALAVFELLDDLLAVIGDFYGTELREQRRQQRAPPAMSEHDPLDPF